MKIRKLLPMLLLAVCMQVIFPLPQKAYASEMIPVTPNETFYGTLETLTQRIIIHLLLISRGILILIFQLKIPQQIQKTAGKWNYTMRIQDSVFIQRFSLPIQYCQHTILRKGQNCIFQFQGNILFILRMCQLDSGIQLI